MRTWQNWNVDGGMWMAEWKIRKQILYLLIACGLLTGCLGSRSFTPVRYYSLEPLVDNTPRATQSWTIPLAIQPFTAATRYRERMLYRVSEVEVNFYEYDRWVEPPEEMVTRLVAASLHASGLFQQVRQIANLQLPAWLLSADLLRFDEVRGARESRAECWLRLELRRAQDEHLLWSKTLQAAAPLSHKTAAGLAAAMTVAVQQIAQQLITELQTADLPRAE